MFNIYRPFVWNGRCNLRKLDTCILERSVRSFCSFRPDKTGIRILKNHLGVQFRPVNLNPNHFKQVSTSTKDPSSAQVKLAEVSRHIFKA